MPVESVFARLEPLLPLVRKPIQYVGGELNAVVKDWDACDVRWALMYPDAYEVGPAQPGRADPVRGAQRARRHAGRADVQRLARPRGAHARARRAAVHRRRAPAGAATSTCWASASRPSSGYTNLLTALDLAGIPLRRARPQRRATRSCVAGGHAAFNPEPIAEFVDAAVARRRRAGRPRDHRRRARLEGRGPPGRPRGAAAAAGQRPAGCTSRAFYDVDYLPDGRIRRVAPNRPGVPWRVAKHTVMDLDAVAVPEARRWCRSPRPCTSG